MKSKRRGSAVILAALVFSGGMLLAQAALAEIDGHGPDAWRITGVDSGAMLEARMGPGAQYLPLSHFEPGESGLQQITCVPLLTQARALAMTEAERAALPPRWCLMRSADLSRAGWVEQRYIKEDVGAAPLPSGSPPAAVRPPRADRN